MKPNLKVGDIVLYYAGTNKCVGRVDQIDKDTFTYTVFNLNDRPYGPTQHSTYFAEWESHKFQILPPTPEQTEATAAMKRWKERID
jgi:hypothetical protein